VAGAEGVLGDLERSAVSITQLPRELPHDVLGVVQLPRDDLIRLARAGALAQTWGQALLELDPHPVNKVPNVQDQPEVSGLGTGSEVHSLSSVLAQLAARVCGVPGWCDPVGHPANLDPAAVATFQRDDAGGGGKLASVQVVGVRVVAGRSADALEALYERLGQSVVVGVLFLGSTQEGQHLGNEPCLQPLKEQEHSFLIGEEALHEARVCPTNGVVSECHTGDLSEDQWTVEHLGDAHCQVLVGRDPRGVPEELSDGTARIVRPYHQTVVTVGLCGHGHLARNRTKARDLSNELDEFPHELARCESVPVSSSVNQRQGLDNLARKRSCESCEQ